MEERLGRHVRGTSQTHPFNHGRSHMLGVRLPLEGFVCFEGSRNEALHEQFMESGY